MGAFHAYDIRGTYNKDFDKDTVYKVGFFLPELLHTDKIAVGRDMRFSSPEIHEYLLQGITDAGADVYDLGLATTPYVYYVTAAKKFKASVQITASHNPKADNGLKVSRENALPVGYDTGLGTIEQWINEKHPCNKVSEGKKGKVYPLDLRREYVAFQMRFKGDYSNLNIALDLCNGVSALFIKDIITEGEKVHYINDKLDGSFPNHEPNPLLPENTLQLRKYVVENKCDIGVIYDGDADRVVFIDEKGEFISPDLMIAVLGNFFMCGIGTSPESDKRRRVIKNHRGKITAKALQDIRSSKAVGEYLSPMGAQINTWRVGRAYAAPKLREIDGLFGGELAGHYYFKDFFYSDSGILASLIILDIMSSMKRQGVSVSQLISKIVRYQNSGEINYKIDKKKEAMDAVRDYFIAKETPILVLDFDGYRVEFKDWWFNIRPSNTEPYLRFICEATTRELLDEKVAKVNEIIQTI